MSYILDALRRAEAERERGHVPSLHTPAAAPHRAGTAVAGSRWRWGLAAAAALVLLLAGALASRWLMDEKPAPANAAPLVAPSPAAALAQAQPPTTSAPASAPTLDPGMVRLEPPSALPQPASLPPPTSAATLPPQPPRSQQAAGTNAPPQLQPTPTPAAPSVAAANEVEPPKRSDLPESTRHELPPLKAGGSMYSSTPASRMLILDGQVFREGDKVGPQLVLEQIRPNSALLSYKGQRFTIAF